MAITSNEAQSSLVAAVPLTPGHDENPNTRKQTRQKYPPTAATTPTPGNSQQRATLRPSCRHLEHRWMRSGPFCSAPFHAVLALISPVVRRFVCGRPVTAQALLLNLLVTSCSGFIIFGFGVVFVVLASWRCVWLRSVELDSVLVFKTFLLLRNVLCCLSTCTMYSTNIYLSSQTRRSSSPWRLPSSRAATLRCVVRENLLNTLRFCAYLLNTLQRNSNTTQHNTTMLSFVWRMRCGFGAGAIPLGR